MTQETTKANVGGQPGNANARLHGARGAIVLGRAPQGHGSTYRTVREMHKALKAEWESKNGLMSPSQGEALTGACHWLVRSRMLHKWARQVERTDTERNNALGEAAEAFDKYVNRLRSIGLAKVSGPGSGDATDDALPPSLLAELEGGNT